MSGENNRAANRLARALKWAGLGLGLGYTAVRRLNRHRPDHGHTGPLGLRAAITINRPAEELYRFWRDFENLPRFMTPPGVGADDRRRAGRTGRRRARPG